MNRWLIRMAGAAVLVLAAVWLWRTLFPPAEAVIKERLKEVARLASFDQREAPFAKLGNATELASFFAQDVEIVVNLRGRGEGRLTGREDLLKTALGVRQQMTSLQVQFPDILVELLPGKAKAVANVTATAHAAGDADMMVQELKFILEKHGRTWLIRRVETVRTLTRGEPAGKALMEPVPAG